MFTINWCRISHPSTVESISTQSVDPDTHQITALTRRPGSFEGESLGCHPSAAKEESDRAAKKNVDRTCLKDLKKGNFVMITFFLFLFILFWIMCFFSNMCQYYSPDIYIYIIIYNYIYIYVICT